MYTLIIENRLGKNAAEISFDQGSYTIGRVDGNDVVLPSSSVSRSHARIFVANNKCYIDDLGSANGIQVDGVTVRERTEIHNGSKIRIGDYTLYLEYKDQTKDSSGQEILKTQIVSGEKSGFKIVRVGDKFAGEEYMLTESVNTIGRTEDNYILLSDSSISRNHAKIVNLNVSFKLTDLKSSNGTFVNNKRISSEVVLQSGDLLRFGNLSFVFVPAVQRVDVTQYANRNNRDSKLLFLAIGGLVACIICAAVAVILLNSNSAENTVTDTADAQQEELNIQIALSENLVKATEFKNNMRFSNAQQIIDDLLKDWPNDERVQKLNRENQFELQNAQLIKDAIAFFDNDNFAEGIDKLNLVDKNCMSYEDAQNKIKEAVIRNSIKEYNAARRKCDTDLNTACIEGICDAIANLNKTESPKQYQDAVNFIERQAKSKAKYASAAKKCLKEIKANNP